MRRLFFFIVCLFVSSAWADSAILATPNMRVLVTTKIPRTVHLDVEEMSANTTFIISWRDEDHVWPQKGKLILGPGNYDRWSGHTFYRPWSYYRLCECCNETIIKRATAVQVTADNITTEWLEIFQ